MPYIAFQAGQLSPEIKKQLITRLTEVSAEIMGIPKDYFFVAIQELDNENIAIAGKTVTEMRAELAERQKNAP